MVSSHLILAALMSVLLLFFSPAPAVAGIVTDSDGEMLQNSLPFYYFVPSTVNVLGSGALSWIPNNNSSSCPLYVKSKGNSVGTIASISYPPRVYWVATSRFVTITFHDTDTPCSDELRWSVTSNNDQLYVTAGPSGSSVSGRLSFEIEEGDSEKNEFYIKFCGSSECDDVGFLENGVLGITPNKPVPFRFVKAFSNLKMPVFRA